MFVPSIEGEKKKRRPTIIAVPSSIYSFVRFRSYPLKQTSPLAGPTSAHAPMQNKIILNLAQVFKASLCANVLVSQYKAAAMPPPCIARARPRITSHGHTRRWRQPKTRILEPDAICISCKGGGRMGSNRNLLPSYSIITLCESEKDIYVYIY